METLLKHIEFTLVHKGEVRIDGIGVFNLNYKNAKIDNQHGFLIPPYKEIIFKDDNECVDPFLISTFSRKYKIDYSEASELVSKKIEILRQNLRKGRLIKIGEFGFLYCTYGGKIMFTQKNNRIFFGLKELSLGEKYCRLANESKTAKDKQRKSKDRWDDKEVYFRIRRKLASVSSISFFTTPLEFKIPKIF